MRLRLVEAGDIPAIVEMGADMVAMGGFAPEDYAPQKVAETIPRFGFAVVAVDGEQVAGFMFGEVVSPWYGAHRMATDCALYVRPEFRGTMAALMMVKAWMRWAVDSGAKQLRPGVSAGHPSAERLYERLGFKRVGAAFVLDV